MACGFTIKAQDLGFWIPGLRPHLTWASGEIEGRLISGDLFKDEAFLKRGSA